MTTLDKEKLLKFMNARFESLDELVTRDFTGALQSRIFERREVKYWKDAIERGEFDIEKGTKKFRENLVPDEKKPEKFGEAGRNLWF